MSEAAQNLFTNKRFRELEPSAQREVLIHELDGFGGLSSSAQDEVIAHQMVKYRGEDDYASALDRGFQRSIANKAHLAANALQLTGMYPGEERELRDYAARTHELNQSPDDRSYLELAAEVVGGLPVELGTAVGVVGGTAAAILGAGASAGTAALLAPVAGFGALGALGASDQGFEASMKSGLIEAAFGALFPLTGHLPRALRAGIIGGASYALAPDDIPLDENLAHSLTMAALAGYHRPRDVTPALTKIGFRDKGREQRISQAMDAKRDVNEELAQHYADRAEIEAAAEAAARNKDSGPRRADQPGVQASEPSMQRTPLEQEAPARSGPQGEASQRGERSDPVGRPAARGGTDATRSPHEAVKVAPGDFRDPGAVGPDGTRISQRGKNHVETRDVAYSTELPRKIVKGGGDVYHNVAREFGFNIRAGGIPKGKSAGKRVLGYFRPTHESAFSASGKFDQFSNALRVAEASDIPTMGHEAGHFLSARTPLGKAMHNNTEIFEKYYHPNAPDIELSKMPGWLQELHHLSYDVRNVEEGFAEFSRHWFTHRDFLADKAPNALARFEAAIEKLPKKQSRAMKAAQKQAHSFYEQGGRAGIESSYGPASDPSNAMSSWSDAWRQGNIDDFHGIVMVARELGLTDPGNVADTFHRLRAKADIQRMMKTEGVPKETINAQGKTEYEWFGEGTDAIVGDVLLTKRNALGQRINAKEAGAEFWNYTTAVQAAELKGQTIGPGGKVQPATAADVALNRTREKLLSQSMIDSGRALEVPEYRRGAKRLMAYQNRVLDFAESQGLFSAEQRALWQRQMYMFSFNREMAASNHGMAGQSDRLASVMGVHRMHGSSKRLKNPYENLLNGPARLIQLAFENRARTELADLGNITTAVGKGSPGIPAIDPKFFRGPRPEGVEGAGAFVERIKATSDQVTIQRKQLTEAMKKELKEFYGINGKDAETALKWLGAMPDGIENISMFLGSHKPLGSEVMTILRDGKKEYYNLGDPVLMRAVEAINRPLQEGFFSWMKNFTTKFITSTPHFLFGNLPRDVVMASILTKTGRQQLTAALNGMRHTTMKSTAYKEFVLNGGGGAIFREGANVSYQRLLRHAQRQRMDPRGLIDPAAPWRWINEFGRSVELWSRVGEYSRGLRQGMSKPEAASGGREVSVDFNRRGDYQSIGGDTLGFLNRSIPFFSAMIAGQDRVYRALAIPGQRANVAARIGLVVTGSGALFSLNELLADRYGDLKDDIGRQMLDWKGLPPWQRAAYWHFYMPTNFDPITSEPTAFKHFTLPKPYEVGMMATWGETFLDRMQNGNPHDRNLAGDLMRSLLTNYMIRIPEGGSAGTGQQPLWIPLPAGINVIAEQAMNRVGFTGADIEPVHLRQGRGMVSPEFRERPGQGPTIRAIGAFTGKHAPQLLGGAARMEHYMRGFFSHWATMGLAVTDEMFFYNDNSPAMSIDRIPGISRFYQRPEKYSVETQEFYDNLRTFGMLRNDLSYLTGKGDVAEAKRRSQDPQMGMMAKQAQGLQRASASLHILHQRRIMLQEGTLWPHLGPRERLKEMEKIRAEILRRQKFANENVRRNMKMAEGR